MASQFRKLNLGYEFVDACDAMSISDDELELINKDRIRANPLTRGEAACVRSHAKACEKLALDTQCEFGLILEDDVIIGHALLSVLDRLQNLGQRSEVVLLFANSYHEVVFSVVEELGASYRLIRPAKLDKIFGTQAYFISKEKAREFSRAIIPVKTFADDWEEYADAGVFSSLAVVFPFPVLHAEFFSVVRGGAAVAKGDIRTKLKNFVYLKKIFPFYQIVMAVRRRKAEIVRRGNIIIPQVKFSKTYKL